MRMQEALSILPFCTNELQEDDVHEINNICMILGRLWLQTVDWIGDTNDVSAKFTILKSSHKCIEEQMKGGQEANI